MKSSVVNNDYTIEETDNRPQSDNAGHLEQTDRMYSLAINNILTVPNVQSKSREAKRLQQVAT